MKQETRRQVLTPNDLLDEMDHYDWSSVEDLVISADQREKKLSYFEEVIGLSGIKLSGSVLEFDAGAISIAGLAGTRVEDFVAMDNGPEYVKALREQGIRAIIGRVDRTMIEDNSFDYVVAINPTLLMTISSRIDYLKKSADAQRQVYKPNPDYFPNVVSRAIAIARKKVLIVSGAIGFSSEIPHPDRLEGVRKKLSRPGSPNKYCCMVYDAKKKKFSDGLR